MDSDTRSPTDSTRSPTDSAGSKASFHKSSHDPSNRKYRRRSPVSGGSSSSDGEPVERSSTTTHKKDDRRDIDRDYNRSRYNKDVVSNRPSDRRSYDDRKHGDYKRREKYAEEDQKNFHKLPPHARGGSGSGSHASYSDHSRREFEQNRSRDDIDKHSRDRSDGSGHRSRDKYKRDDVRDDKRSGRHHHKDISWRDSKELDDPKYSRFEKGKSYDQETRGLKDRHLKVPRELREDESVLPSKKSKFSMDKDTENTNEVHLTSLKEGQEFAGKANTEQEFVKDSDMDAAKVAAMKAAELVNRNLIGTGIMSTDQKKKLLWGSKKSTPIEETAHRWDTSTFSDREREEKFKKLMGVKGDVKVEQKQEIQDSSSLAEKQKELQLDLEKQYTAGLRRRDGRTVGLGL